MMNNEFVRERALAAARQLFAKQPADDDRAIVFAFRQTLGRAPTAAEAALAQQLLTTSGDSRERRWADLYQMLFASIDFRYCD
jgi:hypothetical protein